MEEVAAYGEEKGVVLGLHNHNHGCVTRTGKEVRRILETSKADIVRPLFDLLAGKSGCATSLFRGGGLEIDAVQGRSCQELSPTPQSIATAFEQGRCSKADRTRCRRCIYSASSRSGEKP